jgi:hypothetical protein
MLLWRYGHIEEKWGANLKVIETDIERAADGVFAPIADL